MKLPCVYILASRKKGAFYTGVTSDLIKRIYEHKNDIIKGHASKYEIKNLVYYEIHENMESAIIREKQIKKWKREFKYNIIENDNPEWQDLYEKLI